MQTTERRRCATGMPWAGAYATARDLARALPAEAVAPEAARGRVLAAAVHAAAPVPSFDFAAMDGYAVAGPGPWTVTGLILAGRQPHASAAGRLRAGTAVEIATGAPVPDGAEAVLPYEDSRREGATLIGATGGRTHIRRAGDDLRTGDLVVAAGRTVTATVVAAARQAGAERLTVHRRPAVSLLVTGDEVVMAGPAAPGQVRDSFTGIVDAIAGRAGGEFRGSRHVADDPSALRAALSGADGDVVVVTGSSSAGAADHLHELLDSHGAAWHVRGVACRPGHPQGLAALPDGRIVVSLPGNPYAGLVAALTLLEPLVAALAGRRPAPLPAAVVTGTAKLMPGGVRIAPVRLHGDVAELLPAPGSAALAAAAGADALAVLLPDWTTGGRASLLAVP
ncbi:molybdopterin molybdotransferase MoeA [Actinoplanes sp. URMC 104]|uniref:molybdopterin molybdotransferase MoeA n=1 Tax=Actinoplanes sp. URMC 104 TaxID=3423409 RepID=UPI003F1C8FE8